MLFLTSLALAADPLAGVGRQLDPVADGCEGQTCLGSSAFGGFESLQEITACGGKAHSVSLRLTLQEPRYPEEDAAYDGMPDYEVVPDRAARAAEVSRAWGAALAAEGWTASDSAAMFDMKSVRYTKDGVHRDVMVIEGGVQTTVALSAGGAPNCTTGPGPGLRPAPVPYAAVEAGIDAGTREVERRVVAALRTWARGGSAGDLTPDPESAEALRALFQKKPPKLRPVIVQANVGLRGWEGRFAGGRTSFVHNDGWEVIADHRDDGHEAWPLPSPVTGPLDAPLETWTTRLAATGCSDAVLAAAFPPVMAGYGRVSSLDAAVLRQELDTMCAAGAALEPQHARARVDRIAWELTRGRESLGMLWLIPDGATAKIVLRPAESTAQ